MENRNLIKSQIALFPSTGVVKMTGAGGMVIRIKSVTESSRERISNLTFNTEIKTTMSHGVGNFYGIFIERR